MISALCQTWPSVASHLPPDLNNDLYPTKLLPPSLHVFLLTLFQKMALRWTIHRLYFELFLLLLSSLNPAYVFARDDNGRLHEQAVLLDPATTRSLEAEHVFVSVLRASMLRLACFPIHLWSLSPPLP